MASLPLDVQAELQHEQRMEQRRKRRAAADDGSASPLRARAKKRVKPRDNGRGKAAHVAPRLPNLEPIDNIRGATAVARSATADVLPPPFTGPVMADMAQSTPSTALSGFKCGNCEAAEATLWCGACSVRFCVGCDHTLHLARTKRSHSRVVIRKASETPLCANCNTTVSVWLCCECDKCFCSRCCDVLHLNPTAALHPRVLLNDQLPTEEDVIGTSHHAAVAAAGISAGAGSVRLPAREARLTPTLSFTLARGGLRAVSATAALPTFLGTVNPAEARAAVHDMMQRDATVRHRPVPPRPHCPAVFMLPPPRAATACLHHLQWPSAVIFPSFPCHTSCMI